MPAIHRNIALQVSSDLVLRHLADPAYLTELCPAMLISDVEKHPLGSTKFAWAHKMLGVRLFGEAAIAETTHDQQVTLHFWGGVHGNLVWQVQTLDEGILLEIKLDYITPPPLLKKHTEDDILRHNEYAVEHMLGTLKTLVEAHHARTFNRV
jgi:hypothetical protein